MTPIAQALSAALLHFVWQGLLVAFLLWIALFLLKNRSATTRYLASSIALAMLAILPVLSTWVLYRSPTPPLRTTDFALAIWSAAVGSRAAGRQFAWLPVLQAWALPLWSAGVFVFSIRLAWGWRQVSALRRAGKPASESVLAVAAGLSAKLGSFRTVEIVITSQSDGPSVIGWLRPAILLPTATLLGLTEQQLEAVLAHEFAHIRRHDYLVNLLQNLVETLLFYHPAVWWVSARMRHERELCCDDAAVRCCGDAICYARALTILEKLRGPDVALAMGSTGGHLLYRIQRVVGLKPRENAPSRVPAIAGLFLGIACLALNNVNWAHAQEQEVRGTVGIVRDADSPGVRIDLGGATVLERTGVEYPGYAWENKVGGMVVVETTLDAAGNVSDARVLSGPAELRKNALQSVLEWHFSPAPAGTTRQVSINFQWEEAQKARGNPKASPAAEAEATVRFLKSQLQEAEQNHNEPALINELKRKLEISQEAQELRERGETKTVIHNGRAYAFLASPTIEADPELAIVVSRIDITGLTELQQKQLAEILPVHLGDALTREQEFSLIKALSEFNPPLALGLGRDNNNRLVIRIAPDKPR